MAKRTKDAAEVEAQEEAPPNKRTTRTATRTTRAAQRKASPKVVVEPSSKASGGNPRGASSSIPNANKYSTTSKVQTNTSTPKVTNLSTNDLFKNTLSRQDLTWNGFASTSYSPFKIHDTKDRRPSVEKVGIGISLNR